MSRENEVIGKFIDGLTTGESLNHLDGMIDSIDDVMIELIDEKWAIEDHLLDPLIPKMNNILNNLNKTGTLFKGNDYGTKNLEEWAWYKDSGISAGSIHYIDGNTFYVNGDKRSILYAGRYLLINNSIPRRIESVNLSASNTYVYLSTDPEDDLWDNPYYDPNKATYPTCVSPNVQRSKCDCYVLTEEPYTTSTSTTTTAWEYEPGVFKIIISPQPIDYQNYVVFLNISSSSGINNENLSDVFDEIGEDWRKLYIRNEDETELLHTQVGYWDPDEKRGALYVRVPFMEKNKQTVLMCRYGSELDNNNTHIWQLKTDYPLPPHYHNENDVERDFVYDGVWKNWSYKNNYGYQSYMNYECLNNWCNGPYSYATGASIILNNYNFYNIVMRTRRHRTDLENFVERGYNNIKNALTNKEIIIFWTNGNFFNDPVYENFNRGQYDPTVASRKGWSFSIFLKRKTIFTQKETTEEERKDYENTGISGPNGPHDEYLFNHGGSQFETTSIYWNADNGKLTYRVPKQYDTNGQKTPYIYFESKQNSWPTNWTFITYVYNKDEATLKLYIDGYHDNTHNIVWQQYFSDLSMNMSRIGYKVRAPGWVSEYRYNNFCFITLENYRYYHYPINEERIRLDLLDLKDQLTYYYRITAPH